MKKYYEFSYEIIDENKENKSKKKKRELKLQRLIVKLEQFLKQKNEIPKYTTNSDQGNKNYYDRY